MNTGDIIIKGARVNNLKNIDVSVPRGKLVVITGLSGSGKSSLAFDTLYAEGQRRYVESLSSYARQFLGRMPKPECDFIKGLPPAIAIEQKVTNRNSRSTVGTATETYDYLRMLFARVGHTISPVSGAEVTKHTADDVLRAINAYPTGTRFAILTRIILPEGRDFATQLDIYVKGGYSRLCIGGEMVRIQDVAAGKRQCDPNHCRLLIDRLAVTRTREDDMRVLDSLSTAFFEGGGECEVMAWPDGGEPETRQFSKRFEADGITFTEPTDLMFNFNNPLGACPTCEGFGNVAGIDERLVIPNKTLSVYSGAVMCWRGPTMSQWKDQFIAQAAGKGFNIHTPYCQLTEAARDMLWHGDGSGMPCIDSFFSYVQRKAHIIQYRVLLSRYRGRTVCPDCGGSRLRREAGYVKIGGKSITQLVSMPVDKLLQWFTGIRLTGHEQEVAARLLKELRSRLTVLVEVGLGYLTLDRLSSTLSGGESQRINLATSLGSTLTGSLYILDEPSIGLHSRDTARLVAVLRQLQQLGNTVVVVEHDEDIIRQADYLIDIGPEAGRRGGEVVYAGEYNKKGFTKQQAKQSYTLKYLRGDLSIPLPTARRRWNGYISIEGAAENNLKSVDVKIPLGVITVVTGVSGSGKSTLVCDVLYKAMARHLGEATDAPGAYTAMGGDIDRVRNVEFVDQNPIGKSTRSNPATYMKAFDEIRHLFSEQKQSRIMGYQPSYFSFNSAGGRCETCKGEGTITIEMQFMADLKLECDACHGKRYGSNALAVSYRRKNISDVLDMTVNQAIEFFSEGTGATERRIVKRLQPLQDVGLGYIKLGQSSSTLSGGENQRVKLAYFLCDERNTGTMFIFDEPTTGLHFHDINTLMRSFNQLVDKGHTVVIVEHNMDVIKCADHVIDMGPEGGDDGGTVVVAGTPEEVAACPQSHTGHFLKQKLQQE